jgi:hypothetical protein
MPRQKNAIDAVKRLRKQSEHKAAMKLKILTYLANPDAPWPSRDEVAKGVLGFSHNSGLYRHFDPGELSKIEAEGLSLRRTRYSSLLAQVDNALIKAALGGDVGGIKLCFQRYESWEPGQLIHHVQDDVLPALDPSNLTEAEKAAMVIVAKALLREQQEKGAGPEGEPGSVLH